MKRHRHTHTPEQVVRKLAEGVRLLNSGGDVLLSCGLWRSPKPSPGPGESGITPTDRIPRQRI